MRAKEKGRAANTPRPNIPYVKGCDVSIQQRGEPGTARKASPDPHRPHSPKAKVQGVCW
jgi:hypothetical protein